MYVEIYATNENYEHSLFVTEQTESIAIRPVNCIYWDNKTKYIYDNERYSYHKVIGKIDNLSYYWRDSGRFVIFDSYGDYDYIVEDIRYIASYLDTWENLDIYYRVYNDTGKTILNNHFIMADCAIVRGKYDIEYILNDYYHEIIEQALNEVQKLIDSLSFPD